MNNKKRNKRLAHAEMVFQREQLKAATMSEQLNKAVSVVNQHKQEFSAEEFVEIEAQLQSRRDDIRDFLVKATEKYARKLQELGDPKINFETDEVI